MKLGRTAIIALIASLGFSTASLADVTFTDDDDSVHEADIEAIAALDITRGCNPPDNDQFCPTDPVTRGHMAAFLNRALDLPEPVGDPFVDDDDSIFESDIEALAAAGITRGCNPPVNDRFCPETTVSRGQMAAFLVRAMGYVEDGGGDHFIDDDDSVFEGDIDRLHTAGVTAGCNPPNYDRFCPGAEVSREQMASFLARALSLSPKVCAGSQGSVVIVGDLVVPSGATCYLEGTTIVTGNLLVRSESTLLAIDVSVEGSIRSEGHRSVAVLTSFVGSTVVATEGAAVDVRGNLVDAGIYVQGNEGGVIIDGNSVIEDIVVRSNTGGVTITGNGIDGSLICEDNDPPPTGGGNAVLSGTKEGQCADL